MDIRQWLQNTADREPPDEGIETGFPAFLQPEPNAAQPLRRSRQKRKRASSDPPVPTHRPSHKSRRAVRPSSSVPARPSEREPIAKCSRSSSSSSSEGQQSTVSSRPRVSTEKFARRARRKTRPERYESKPKQRKKEPKSRREKKPESRRRSSHRNGDGARTTGLVQSFHLKNGPKNQRLTLKPDASAGIFKHGRASGPVATSGPGLPDLVFNEMRFLRRPKEHQDELPAADPLKQSKKTRKQIQEEEISSYFNKTLHPGKQASLARADVAESPALQRIPDRCPTKLDLDRPKHPVELPDKPFLGFGSRGSPQEGMESRVPSDSCYTWSESVPAKQSPPRNRALAPDLSPASECSRRRERRPSQQSNALLSRSKGGFATLQQHLSPSRSGEWVQNRRVNTPVVIDEYHSKRSAQPHSAPFVDESSEPLPGAVMRAKSAELEETGSRGETGSYHTSDILKTRDTINKDGRFHSRAEEDLVGKAGSYNDRNSPPPSTPTSEGLRHAFGAVARVDRPTPARIPTSRAAHQACGFQVEPPTMQRGSLHEHSEVEPSPPRWEMPRRGFSRTSDANQLPNRPSSRLATATRPTNTQRWQPRSREARVLTAKQYNPVDGEDMNGVLPDSVPSRGYMRINTREAEALVRRLGDNPGEGLPQQPAVDNMSMDWHKSASHQEELIDSREGYEPGSFEPVRFSVPSQQLGVDDILDDQFLSDHLTPNAIGGEESLEDSHRGAVNADLAGFWKPNMLY